MITENKQQFRVRTLLRVSSSKQLDPNGDLDTQRRIVLEYIKRQESDGWYYDESDSKSEYFEGGVSGYRVSVEKREVLQQIMRDAQNKEFDILVCYKDDRLGRRGEETLGYIKELAENGVQVYTTTDGLLTPAGNIEELMGYLRFWHAKTSSMDTGQRVHDNAVEQVKRGKNMGGQAPYGYELVPSGELSKHQRALKKKKIVPEQAAVVRHIYDLAIQYGYGYHKITRLLNENEYYSKMAPNGNSWKSGTVRDILRNPIYTGYQAYDRRRHEGDHYRRLSREEWVLSEECNEELKIMEVEDWEKVQNIREDRKEAMEKEVQQNARVTQKMTGNLPLIDVVYCGYCGSKLSNGTKYNYWTTKAGEKKESRVRYYRCQGQHRGELCEGPSIVRADDLEDVVFNFIKMYLDKLQDNNIVLEKVVKAREDAIKRDQKKCEELQRGVDQLDKDLDTLENYLPSVLRGEIGLTLDIWNQQRDKYQSMKEEKLKELKELQSKLAVESESTIETQKLMVQLPLWAEALEDANSDVKRVIVNKLVERIDVYKDNIKIKFKVNLDDFFVLNDGCPRYHSVNTRFSVTDIITNIFA